MPSLYQGSGHSYRVRKTKLKSNNFVKQVLENKTKCWSPGWRWSKTGYISNAFRPESRNCIAKILECSVHSSRYLRSMMWACLSLGWQSLVKALWVGKQVTWQCEASLGPRPRLRRQKKASEPWTTARWIHRVHGSTEPAPWALGRLFRPSPWPPTLHTLCSSTQLKLAQPTQAVRAPHFSTGRGEDDSHPKDGTIQQNLPWI